MLGEKLRASRKARGLSLQEVSVEAGISAATLSRIETNKQTVELGLFISIARILGSDPRDMLVVGDEGTAGTLDAVVQRFASLKGRREKSSGVSLPPISARGASPSGKRICTHSRPRWKSFSRTSITCGPRSKPSASGS